MTRQYEKADLVWVNTGWFAANQCGREGFFGLVIDRPDYDAEVVACWDITRQNVVCPQPHQLVLISRVADD